MNDDRPSELDVKRAIYRECGAAAESLARAFYGADEAFPFLSRDAATIVERQLFDVYRRTFRIIGAIGLGLTHEERNEHALDIQGTHGGGDGGSFAGDGGDITRVDGSGSDGGGGSGDAVPLDTWEDDDPTPRVMTEPLFHAGDLTNGAVVAATAYLGTKEDPPGSNSGTLVNEFLASVGLEPGVPWCAAFVHFCFLQAANALEMLNPCPRTGGSLRMWELAPDAAKVRHPVRGSIFISDHGHGKGHCGIVEAVNGGGLIETVEGNSDRGGSRTGGSVVRHIWRPEDGARGLLVGYIDLALVPLVHKKDGAG